MVEAVDRDHVWRVYGGECDGAHAQIQRSDNGGRTWLDIPSPLPVITRLQLRSTDEAFVVGADSSCRPQLRSTTDAGAAWAATSDPSRAWYIDPADRHVFNSPGAGPSRPCQDEKVLGLAVTTVGGARILCGDGTVRQTADSGRSWSTMGQVPQAVTMAVPQPDVETTYVLRHSDGCDGIEIVALDRPNQTVSCVPTPDHLQEVALTIPSRSALLLAGEQLLRSSDLVSWTRVDASGPTSSR